VATLLKGQFNHSLDSKGRIIVPAKLRSQLGEGFVISKGLDKCLYGYSIMEWAKFEEKLSTLPLANKSARTFVRFFLAGASDMDFDKQGRILIPQELRDYAGLKGEVIFTGAGNHIEIWDKATWDAESEAYDANMDEITEDLSDIGFNI